MRIEYRDQQRKKIGRMQVDPAARPTRVPVIEPGIHEPQREAFLNWEGAVDDAGRLRKCIACGCPDLFREKAFPQVTGFVVVLAFVGAVVGLMGLATNLPVMLLLTVVLVLDVAILVFSQRRLVCYQCRSSYHELEIPRYHRVWDRAVADRYPAPSREARDAGAAAAPALAGGASAPATAGATATVDVPAAVMALRPRPLPAAPRSESADAAVVPTPFADAADLPLERKSYFA
jgi:hypothetical protein